MNLETSSVLNEETRNPFLYYYGLIRNIIENGDGRTEVVRRAVASPLRAASCGAINAALASSFRGSDAPCSSTANPAT